MLMKSQLAASGHQALKMWASGGIGVSLTNPVWGALRMRYMLEGIIWFEPKSVCAELSRMHFR